MDGLVRLGEYAEVDIGHQRYIAPTMPRWMPTGPATGAMLGAAVVPEGVVELPGDGGRDLVRRIRVRDDDDLATLHIAGIRETSLEEWLRLSDTCATPHAERGAEFGATKCRCRSSGNCSKPR